MKNFIILLLLSFTALTSCTKEITQKEDVIEWDIVEPGDALLLSLCDSMSCVIHTVDYTFEDVELVMIYYRDWVNCDGCWTAADTLFYNDELLIGPYLGMALFLNLPDSIVCSSFVIQGNLMSFSGRIQWDAPYASGDHVFRVDEVDHPYRQIGFWKDCN